MQKLCDDLNKVLPRITGHLLGWQLMLVEYISQAVNINNM